MDPNIKSQALFRLKTKVPEFAAKLAPVYKMLGWQWLLIGPKIPSSADIADELNRLIDSVEQRNYLSSASGGLMVEWDNENLSASMSFCINELSD